MTVTIHMQENDELQHSGRQLPGVEAQAAQLAADLAARTGDLYALLQSSQQQVWSTSPLCARPGAACCRCMWLSRAWHNQILV